MQFILLLYTLFTLSSKEKETSHKLLKTAVVFSLSNQTQAFEYLLKFKHILNNFNHVYLK